jgi:hypothetical protein
MKIRSDLQEFVDQLLHKLDLVVLDISWTRRFIRDTHHFRKPELRGQTERRRLRSGGGGGKERRVSRDLELHLSRGHGLDVAFVDPGVSLLLRK